MNPSQATFSCRECGAAITTSASQCNSCGCKAPFACAECGKALSAVSLAVKRSHKYPYGAYSAQGEPLCADHRITRCHQCSGLFPLHLTTRKSIGERADTNLRHGMKPRMEKIYGSFCPDCYAKAVRSSSRSNSEEAQAAPNYGLLVGLLLFALLAVAGLAVLLLVIR